MKTGDTRGCERHPGERVITKCSQCGRGICRACREEHGYFCSEECKHETIKAKPAPGTAELEERRRRDVVEKKVNRWMWIATRGIIPGIAAVIAVIVIIRVTGKAGKKVWEFKPDADEPFSSIALCGENLVARCGGKVLYALDRKKGTVRWTFQTKGSLEGAKVVVAGPELCITWDDENMYAVHPETGKFVWEYPLGGALRQEPVAGDGVICFVVDACRKLTREELAGYTQENSIHYYNILSSFSDSDEEDDVKVREASFIHALGVFCYSQREWDTDTSKDVLYALDSRTGSGRWKAEVQSGSLAVVRPAAGGVFLASDENLYFLSAEGRLIWKQERAERGLWVPVVAEDRVYCRTGQKELTCMELSTGKKIWSREVGDLTSMPVPVDGLVLVTGLVEEEAGEEGAPGVRMPQPNAPGLDTDEFVKTFTEGAEARVKFSSVLYALDKDTGETGWACEDAGGELLCSGGKIFAVSPLTSLRLLDQEIATNTRITALKTQKGEVLWKHLHEGNVSSWAADAAMFYFTSSSDRMGFGGMFSSAPQKPRDNAVVAVSIGR